MSDATRIPAELNPLELHYFRIPREGWELMLARLRQMGADAISTIVPWSWHEPYDGVFDLTGITHAERGLTDLVEACRAMGFPLVMQVNPYPGAGLLGGKAYSMVYDKAKIKRAVPEFQATVRFSEGIRRSVDWFESDPRRKIVNSEANRLMDRIVESHFGIRP